VADLDLEPRNAVAWWDMMLALRNHLGERTFVAWLTTRLKGWEMRAKVINALAWNDHNSDWFLFREQILKTRKFEDGEPVTPESVAQAVARMLPLGT